VFFTNAGTGVSQGRYVYTMINALGDSSLSDLMTSSATELAVDLNGSLNQYPYLVQDEKTGLYVTPNTPTYYRVLITKKTITLTAELQRWLYAVQTFVAPVYNRKN